MNTRIALPVLTCLCFLVTPVLAGTVNVTDGAGTWLPTHCAAPQAPGALPTDPETPANDLNAQMSPRAAYVAAMESYMKCLSQEAETDAAATGQLIVRSAQEMIQKAHDQVTAITKTEQAQ